MVFNQQVNQTLTLKAMEDALQMASVSKEDSFLRDISCANVEYFLRISGISDMSGERSEAWASAYNKREYYRNLKERKGE